MAKQKMNLGPLAKIPIGQGRCFIVGEAHIAIFRPRSGGLCAVHNICPHRQASLAEGVIDHDHVICPYHGHTFNLKTGQGSETGERVQVYPVWEEGANIMIEVGHD